MWTYSQSSGDMKRANGETLACGYSGCGPHKNVSASDAIVNQGPIPKGRYMITAPRTTIAHGGYVLGLIPDVENTMHGRSGFLIHGDAIQHPGEASNGCIILPRSARLMIWASGDRLLEVTA
jgi:hypothetical protein